jgi:hypothetical protein
MHAKACMRIHARVSLEVAGIAMASASPVAGTKDAEEIISGTVFFKFFFFHATRSKCVFVPSITEFANSSPLAQETG